MTTTRPRLGTPRPRLKVTRARPRPRLYRTRPRLRLRLKKTESRDQDLSLENYITAHNMHVTKKNYSIMQCTNHGNNTQRSFNGHFPGQSG